jgi:glyoxylase-like metal-dependent hydrolase (beta-lactamase superfamily II)
MVGKVRVNAISDGYIDAGYGAFTGVPEADIAARFKSRHAANLSAARLGVTTWLIEDGSSLVLIDAGAAGGGFAQTGRLPHALELLGVPLKRIDIVAVTHLHSDHIGGLVPTVGPDTSPFVHASIAVPGADYTHFTDEGRLSQAPDHLKGSFEAATRLKKSYLRLSKISAGEKISARIQSIDLRGHTPGHTGYRITSEGKSLVIVGDLLFDPAVHPGRSDIGIAFEADPAAAQAMRTRAFPQFAEEGALLAATHMPFPGLGRIVRDGKELRWLPADWEYPA